MGGFIGDVLGAVTGGLLGTNMQAKAQQEAMDAQRRAEMEARRIAAEKKPMSESATLKLNTAGTGDALGSLGLLVEPTVPKNKPTAGLNTGVATGLGFGGK